MGHVLCVVVVATKGEQHSGAGNSPMSVTPQDQKTAANWENRLPSCAILCAPTVCEDIRRSCPWVLSKNN